MQLHIVLVEPQIHPNTGNISRTCSVTNIPLHLVHPLGFEITDARVRRAGLDYWSELDLHEYQSFGEVKAAYPEGEFFYCSTKAPNVYSDVDFTAFDGDVFLVFGREDRGLPEDLLRENIERCIRIPMLEKMRSLNLSNSVAIVAYEALRQNDFAGLEKSSEYLKAGD